MAAAASLLGLAQAAVLAAALPLRPEPALAQAAASAWPGPLLPAMRDEPQGAYLELMSPLVHAVSVVYRSSSGPEHVVGMDRATLPDGAWVRLPETEADPTTGGVHGRTFVDHAGQRVIVAFRGICTNNGFRQCQVDKCFLQSFSALGSLSKVAYAINGTCDQFAGELDYVRQADGYVRAVQARLPGYALLLTGHSLGGALAIAVAAKQPGLKALTFAPTAFHELLLREGLDEAAIAALPAEDLVAVGDPYDCMINTVYVHQAREGATTCLLEDLQEPMLCQEGMKTEALSASELPAVSKLLGCKSAAHNWARYEALLLAASPGGRPRHLPRCSLEASVFQAQ